VRGKDGAGLIVFSKEGVAQGDPLSMFAYGVATLPLIRHLKSKFPTLYQTSYADDASAIGPLELIRDYFRELEKVGPKYGYFPEPSKSILVVRSINKPRAQEFLTAESLGFKLTEGSRYLGGHVGETSSRNAWLEEKISNWRAGIQELAQAAGACPQSVCAGLQKSL